MKNIILLVFSLLITYSTMAQDDEESVNGFEVKQKRRVNVDGDNSLDDEITFIIFDSKKMKEFAEEFPTIDYKNYKVRAALKDLTKTQYSDFKFPTQSALFNSKCTDRPESKDFEIAQVVIKSGIDSGSKFVKSNFNGAINYLYFYKCLPEEIQTKWYQELTGNYKFNANMIAILRENSFLLDELITGVKQKELSEVDMIFGGHNFNEIEKQEAQNIKQVLSTNKELKDNSMLESKKIMFECLNRVLSGDWRLFIVEW